MQAWIPNFQKGIYSEIKSPSHSWPMATQVPLQQQPTSCTSFQRHLMHLCLHEYTCMCPQIHSECEYDFSVWTLSGLHFKRRPQFSISACHSWPLWHNEAQRLGKCIGPLPLPLWPPLPHRPWSVCRSASPPLVRGNPFAAYFQFNPDAKEVGQPLCII